MQKFKIDEKNKTIYSIKFSNITDLYQYIKSNPQTNDNIFKEKASIAKNPLLQQGEPLDIAIEYCINGNYKGYNNFLKASDKLVTSLSDNYDIRELKRTMYGGFAIPALVAAGVPDSMLRYSRDTKASTIDVYFNLGYSAYEDENQIINRGLSTLYIIRTLESKGYMVNFKTFTLIKCDNEFIYIEIVLKKPGDLLLDINKCYFPMVGIEFNRRILFRIMESMDVSNAEWNSYGISCLKDEIKETLNINDTKLLIPSSYEIGLTGKNIEDDALTLINYLNLQDEFNIERIKSLKLK